MIKRRFARQRLGGGDPVFRRCVRLLPTLARWGAAPMDALAVAYNAAFIFEYAPKIPFAFSPKGILRRYSFAEIASICEDIISNSDVERGCNINYTAKGWR